MSSSIFFESEFWLLVIFSTIVPITVYGVLLKKRAISRFSVLALGLALIVIAGLDVYLLQTLTRMAKVTPSVLDDGVFLSELTISFYLLPALFGGVGVNIISHVLIRHLSDAEKRFEKEHSS